MEKKQYSFELTVFAHERELSAEDRELLRRAISARKQAYAPYSNFKVGAALMLDDGTIVTGNNQENACYPSGLCAERVALYHAAASYPERPIVAIAVAAASAVLGRIASPEEVGR